MNLDIFYLVDIGGMFLDMKLHMEYRDINKTKIYNRVSGNTNYLVVPRRQ